MIGTIITDGWNITYWKVLVCGANSEAALSHNAGIPSQTILPKIISISTISRFDVYGNPDEELQKALTSFGSQTYNLFAGLVVND